MVNAKNVTQEHSGRQERKQLIVLLAHLAITSRDQVLLDVEGEMIIFDKKKLIFFRCPKNLDRNGKQILGMRGAKDIKYCSRQ